MEQGGFSGEAERGPEGTELERYLRGFQELAALYGRRAVGFAPDPDNRSVIEHYATVVQEQIRGLSDTILTAYSQAPESLRDQVDQFLTISAGNTLVSGASDPMNRMSSALSFGHLGAIFTLIKKIIKLLWGLLHIHLPISIDDILHIIDEIIDAITGGFSAESSLHLHRTEIRYLEAQYHLTRLNQLTRNGSQDADDNGNGRAAVG
jgi:hypothetical protein